MLDHLPMLNEDIGFPFYNNYSLFLFFVFNLIGSSEWDLATCHNLSSRTDNLQGLSRKLNMWVIVLFLVNVILNTVDARYIKLVHKGKQAFYFAIILLFCIMVYLNLSKLRSQFRRSSFFFL